MYLSYFGIRVTDVERSVRFYTELLGLKEVDRGDGTNEGLGVFVLLRDERSGLKLELNWYPKGSQYDAPYVPGEGLDHIAFCVDDLKAAYDSLVSKGAGQTEWKQTEGSNYCYVRDPDGNWVELYEKKGREAGPLPAGY